MKGGAGGAETSPSHTHSPSPSQRSSRARHRSHLGWPRRYVLVMGLNQGSTRHKAKAMGCEDFRRPQK